MTETNSTAATQADARPAVCVLDDPRGQLYNTICGIRGVAEALDSEFSSGDVDSDQAQRLVMGLQSLTEELWSAHEGVDSGTRDRIAQALTRPDTKAEQLHARVRAHGGCSLWCHPTNGSYAVTDGHGLCRLSLASADEVESWLERDGSERGE